jgi:dTMP kinase
LEEYDNISNEYGLTVVDATLPIQKQQEMIRAIVKEKLNDYDPTPFLKKKENVFVA